MIAAEAVTATFMSGRLLPALLDAVEDRGTFDHGLRRMVIFFGTPELLDRTTRLLGPIWAHGFGSPEQGASATRLLPGDVAANRERILSVGRAPGRSSTWPSSTPGPAGVSRAAKWV